MKMSAKLKTKQSKLNEIENGLRNCEMNILELI